MYIALSYLCDKCLYFRAVLLFVRLDAAADIDAPRLNLLQRGGDVLNGQAASQQDWRSPRRAAGKLPVMGCARATPGGRGRVEQQAPGDVPVALDKLKIGRLANVQSLDNRALDPLAECGRFRAV